MKPTLALLTLLALCSCSHDNPRDVHAAGPVTPPPAPVVTTSPAPNSGSARLEPGALPEPAQPRPSPATTTLTTLTTPTTPTTGANDAIAPAPADPAPVDEPSGITDDQLAQTVRTALSNDAVLASAAKSASVSASMGVVTLRGTVRTDADKSRAETIAHGVAGVERIDNQLEVVPE